MGLDVEATPAWEIADWIMDTIFLTDMLLSFRTAYPEVGGALVTVPDMIARKYLRGFFIIDCLSTVPFDKLAAALANGEASNSAKSMKFVRIARMVRLAKLLRLMRVSKLLGDLQDNLLEVDPSFFRGLTMVMILTVLAHFFGCFWNLFTEPVEDASRGENYLRGVYWAFTTMTTVGYGDITAGRADGEASRLYVTVIMILGATVFGYIVGSASTLATAENDATTLRDAKMASLAFYFDEKSVSSSLRHSITSFMEYKVDVSSVFDEDDLLNALPVNLRDELVLFMRREAADYINMLAPDKCEPDLVVLLARHMTPYCCTDGNCVYHPDEVSHSLYFVLQGHCLFVERLADSGAEGGSSAGTGGFTEVPRSWIQAGQSFGCEDVLFGKKGLGVRCVSPLLHLHELALERLAALVDAHPSLGAKAMEIIGREVCSSNHGWVALCLSHNPPAAKSRTRLRRASTAGVAPRPPATAHRREQDLSYSRFVLEHSVRRKKTIASAPAAGPPGLTASKAAYMKGIVDAGAASAAPVSDAAVTARDSTPSAARSISPVRGFDGSPAVAATKLGDGDRDPEALVKKLVDLGRYLKAQELAKSHTVHPNAFQKFRKKTSGALHTATRTSHHVVRERTDVHHHGDGGEEGGAAKAAAAAAGEEESKA